MNPVGDAVQRDRGVIADAASRRSRGAARPTGRIAIPRKAEGGLHLLGRGDGFPAVASETHGKDDKSDHTQEHQQRRTVLARLIVEHQLPMIDDECLASLGLEDDEIPRPIAAFADGPPILTVDSISKLG